MEWVWNWVWESNGEGEWGLVGGEVFGDQGWDGEIGHEVESAAEGFFEYGFES